MTTATAAPPAGAPERRSFRDAWLITLGHVLTHWYPATFFLLLPLIGAELGLSYSQIGLIMTCQALAQAVANIPGGIVVDTVGRKGLLMAVSLFWVGFPYLLIGLTHSYPMLLVCIALVGFGNSIWHPTAIPALANAYPQRKGFVLSIHSMGGNVGDAAAPLVVGALLAVFSWREVVVMNVAPGFVMALLILAFTGTLQLGRKRRAPAEGLTLASYARGVSALVRDRAVVLLSTSSAFRSMTQTGLLTFLPLYLANEMKLAPVQVGLAMFALQIAGFAAAPIAGHLSDRMGPRQIVAGSMAATAVVIAAMAFAGQSTAFIVLIAVLGFFLYSTRAVIQAWLMDVTPKDLGGSSVGILFGAQAVGGAFGPFVGGLLADRYGLITAFWFLAATIVVGNLFVLVMPKTAQHAKPAAA